MDKTGFNIKSFGSQATKILVDIDQGQLFNQVLKSDYGIQADIHEFLTELLYQIETNNIRFSVSPKWIEACHTWKTRYPLTLDEYFLDIEHVNSYVFMDKLSDLLFPEDILVTGNGLDEASYWQAFKVKEGQRTMLNGNWGSMGWGSSCSCRSVHRKRSQDYLRVWGWKHTMEHSRTSNHPSLQPSDQAIYI